MVLQILIYYQDIIHKKRWTQYASTLLLKPSSINLFNPYNSLDVDICHGHKK
jgi:hypothetical protein